MKQKGFTPILIVLLIAVAIGGYFIYQNQTKPTPPPQQSFDNTQGKPTQPSPTPAEETIYTEASQSANWKTYTSTAGRFTIQYPNNWLLVSNQKCQACLENIELNLNTNPTIRVGGIGVYDLKLYPNTRTIDDYVDKYLKKNNSIGDIKFIAIGGERAVSYRYLNGVEPLNLIDYSVTHNSKYYVMGLEGTPEIINNKDKNIKLFNQILSTFKFLD